jgi:hypothetical protein
LGRKGNNIIHRGEEGRKKEEKATSPTGFWSIISSTFALVVVADMVVVVVVVVAGRVSVKERRAPRRRVRSEMVGEFLGFFFWIFLGE